MGRTVVELRAEIDRLRAEADQLRKELAVQTAKARRISLRKNKCVTCGEPSIGRECQRCRIAWVRTPEGRAFASAMAHRQRSEEYRNDGWSHWGEHRQEWEEAEARARAQAGLK